MSSFIFTENVNGILAVGNAWDFEGIRASLADRLLLTDPFNAGKWQQLDVSGSDAHKTYELLNVTMWLEMPETRVGAKSTIHPDLPWAEDHFQERVGRKPINPGVEHANWPYHANGAELHLNERGKYDHNYMERIWSKDLWPCAEPGGYRFEVGDLDDVVTQLGEDPGTRQAYLPIWFPEDTGATQGQRVPCSLGYHFIIRGGKIHLQYNLRSCEVYRHFTNDVYMAIRLAQWVRDELQERYDVSYELGQLTQHMVSFHGFFGDTPHIERLARNE